MHVIIQGVLLTAAWRWGDWRHWQRYYSTILFLIIGDMFNEFINYNYPLWTYVPNFIDKSFFQNHTIITMGQSLLGFPALVMRLILCDYPDPLSSSFVGMGYIRRRYCHSDPFSSAHPCHEIAK